jgi:hypothetical protein
VNREVFDVGVVEVDHVLWKGSKVEDCKIKGYKSKGIKA